MHPSHRLSLAILFLGVLARLLTAQPLFLTASFHAPHPPLFPPKSPFEKTLAASLPAPARGDGLKGDALSPDGDANGHRIRLEGENSAPPKPATSASFTDGTRLIAGRSYPAVQKHSAPRKDPGTFATPVFLVVARCFGPCFLSSERFRQSALGRTHTAKLGTRWPDILHAAAASARWLGARTLPPSRMPAASAARTLTTGGNRPPSGGRSRD